MKTSRGSGESFLNFVLERVVKDQCLSVAPLPRLASHAYRCTLAHGKTHVHAKTDVRRALRKREEQLRAHVWSIVTGKHARSVASARCGVRLSSVVLLRTQWDAAVSLAKVPKSKLSP